jgi:hypothetical protein
MTEPDETGRSWRSRVGRIAAIVLLNIVLLGVLLALLEGAASLLFIANEIVRTPGVPEHNHAEHDTLLGWVNVPDADLPDFYGPGIGVRTNAQRFRAEREYSPGVPPGRFRVICSGDSFTFAYGVGNEDAWCERLTRLDPRLESINMGLGGYGVDQAYLWYMRDGRALDHDMQLFVFLTDDFRRMRSDRFMGYGKPLLDVRDDSIVVTNLPVPRTSWLSHRRALHGETIGRLNIVRLAQRLFGVDRGESDSTALAARDERVRIVVERIFADLKAANDARGSTLVLVFMPGAWDHRPDAETDAWRAFVGAQAARQEIPLIDMVEEIRRLTDADVQSMYAPNLHFNAAGNAWAARLIHARVAPLVADGVDGADR